MQFPGRRKKVIGSSQNDLYDHCLQFYGQPPLENISLTEFETFAVERLKLLKSVENIGVSYVKNSEQYVKKLDAEFSSLNFPLRTELGDRRVQGGTSEYEKRRKDHISHFILRLAYCQTEDLRRWFIQQEMDLFRYRFGELTSKHKTDFLHKNNLKYETVSAEEKKSLKDKLITSSYGLSGITVEEYDFYKVPFQDALDLVRTRKVYLLAGNAYIPHHEIVTIVLNDFRTRLSKALAMTARSLPAVQSDERLQPLLSHLSHAYVGQDYSIQKNMGKISLEQIDALSGKSFPLCMRHLHKALRENHHLRHGGRMQYGLFLKGIGLTLDQALQFWRSEFVKGKVDADKILELVKGMHYQLACQKYFELTHNVEDAGFSLNHPNQYFTESQKLLGGGLEIKKEVDMSQRSQENPANMTRPSQANSKQAHEEMGDLDSFFQDE
ncbi:DNA primase large subunit-like isoform X1 [Cyprinus carpio]|uniref:DNA primase large subunit n=1 Tax=Cyprinus carpio TaxID=7962 RepID=A0A9Q9YR21_CYPCA|nr:DNA primase large subunit-like isoform X1 [Cyprinus carpio]